MNNGQSSTTATYSFRETTQAYLRLQLDAQTQAVIPMKQMQEVVVVPIERITSIPNMPDCVFGLLNQRSRVFWVIELPRLLELSPLDPQLTEYNIAIVRADNIPMGLVVQQILGVMRFSEELIQSPIGAVAPGVSPYLRGCLLQRGEGILLVLDAIAIVNAPVLQQLN
jgi:twitching motility protein PilI